MRVQRRIVKIKRGPPRHAEFFHEPPTADIGLAGHSDQVRHGVNRKAPVDHCPHRFLRIAHAPAVLAHQPANFVIGRIGGERMGDAAQWCRQILEGGRAHAPRNRLAADLVQFEALIEFLRRDDPLADPPVLPFGGGQPLGAGGPAPGILQLEVAESVLMRDAKASIETLHQLKDMGIQLAVDGFGTGFSSLSQLARFPLDVLKIDSSLIRDIRSAKGNGIAASAIQMLLSHSSQGLSLK